MTKFSGYLFTLAAIGLLFYGDPRGVDIVVAYAWLVTVLALIVMPITALSDPKMTHKTFRDATKAKHKIKIAWSFFTVTAIGLGLASHGAIVTSVFYLVSMSLMKLMIISAADARLKQDAVAAPD